MHLNNVCVCVYILGIKGGPFSVIHSSGVTYSYHFPRASSFYDAQAACEATGGSLAMIETADIAATIELLDFQP